MKNGTNSQKQKYFELAVEYVSARLAPGKHRKESLYRLNRGDIILLVMLIEQELKADPSNEKRLNAILEKLGDLVADAPQMSREEAQFLQ